MSKILKRAMFNKPKHEHRSTGIASGLEYRDGYAVGGRVGFAHGGVHPTFAEKVDAANKALIEDLQSQQVPVFASPQLKDDPLFYGQPLVGADVNFPMGDPFRRVQEPGPIGRPGDMFGVGGLDPKSFAGRRLDETLTTLGKAGEVAASGAPEVGLPSVSRMQSGEVTEALQIKPTAISTQKDAKNFYDEFFRTDKQINANRAKLDAELQKLRNRQDTETKKLAEKFNKATRTEAILEGLAAANDPNLRQGQSRVASGVAAFSQRAGEGRRERLERAERDQAAKFLREESDLATKFSRAEDDIRREKDVRDYGLKLNLSNKFGENEVADLEKINYLLDQFDIKAGSALHENIAMGVILGKPAKEEDYADLRRKIADTMREENSAGNYNEFRRLMGITERFDENGRALPLDFQDRLLAEQMFIVGTTLPREEDADGGRVGYSIGGQVTKETLAPEEVAAVSKELNNNEVPLIMNYGQLRRRLPKFIDDEVVSLIAYSPNAFKDFAIINNQADVEDFNNKYDVRLQLPDADSMDFSEAENKTAAMPAVTVPSATPAQPTVAPQMSTGGSNLSPAEVAFLSPTEQAIKMRSS
tara:strand:+ start:86 stop:1852 length:1767 start_codon:yes stop_codon:yes gene_type:complete